MSCFTELFMQHIFSGNESNWRRIDLLRLFEGLAYILSICGIMMDQLSTRIGLSRPNIVELNPRAVYLMNLGMYLYVDIFIAFSMIAFCYLTIKFWGFKNRWAILFLPFTFGVLRLSTGILNIHHLLIRRSL